MFSPLKYGVAVSAMDNEKQPDKRATRLGNFFAGSDVIADFESQSPKVIPPQIDTSGDERTSDKKAKTLLKSIPDIPPKAQQVSKPPKRVAFAGLPVIVENPTAILGPKKAQRHFERYYKITLGRNMDVQLARTKPAAFEEKPPLLDEKQSSVLFWTLSGSESEEQVSVVRKIENRRFVKGIGVYTMPTPGEFTVVYEFMPVSLAEIAASRKVRGPELAYILKQILDGLLYLEEHDIGHPELSCSNVLLDTSGQVKIWGQHFCSYGTTDNLLAGFWRITVELMNGYLKKDMQGDHVDYAKWTAYPAAVDFYKCLETLNHAQRNEERLLPAKTRTLHSRFETVKEPADRTRLEH
ncbi:Serine-threonine/tyrosine-protein kinase, catalytic domain [Fusarium oxysporum f. sp. vasinfectum]|nr:Serine-threonine/tyrosine-protein kinase, catalytic domain [Fusarium oxysporum f. sp. vasinfectum]